MDLACLFGERQSNCTAERLWRGPADMSTVWTPPTARLKPRDAVTSKGDRTAFARQESAFSSVLNKIRQILKLWEAIRVVRGVKTGDPKKTYSVQPFQNQETYMNLLLTHDKNI